MARKMLPNTDCCPACGETLKKTGETRVDLDENYIQHNGMITFVTPVMAEILWALSEKAPAVVRTNAILAQIYGGGDGPIHAAEILRVQICNANKKIAPLGLTIENAWAVGYALRPLKKDAA
jgi:DNA-binding response OmpR family regulator